MKQILILIILIISVGCSDQFQDELVIYQDLSSYKSLYYEEGLKRYEDFEYPSTELRITNLRYPDHFRTTDGKVLIDRDWFQWHSDTEREILIFREITRSAYGVEYGEGLMSKDFLEVSVYETDREGILDDLFRIIAEHFK